MTVLTWDRIQPLLDRTAMIAVMREALLAQARGECETPMPMHLDIPPSSAEVHIKSSFRRGGKYFALKMAGTFPANRDKGLSTGCGMMLLCSANTGEPLVLLEDGGQLTDYRTAAVAALMARELGRRDTALGILGTGIQARLQAWMHAAVLDLERVVIWGRNPDRAAECAADIRKLLPGVEVFTAETPIHVAGHCRIIVTCTGSRAPLLQTLPAGTHISAIGADSVGKQELHRQVLDRAALLLVDSQAQCERLGESQHAPGVSAMEMGAFLLSPTEWDREGITVCDFTGLGVEDLYIAEYCYQRSLT